MNDPMNFALGVAAGACWQLVQDTRIELHEQMHRDLQLLDDWRFGRGARPEPADGSRVWYIARDFAVNDNLTPVWDPRDLSGSMSREALDIGLRKLALQVQSGDWWERKMEELMGREHWKTPAPLPCPSRLLAEALQSASAQPHFLGGFPIRPGELAMPERRAAQGLVYWLIGMPTNRYRKP